MLINCKRTLPSPNTVSLRSHTKLLTEKKVVNYNPTNKKKDSASDASFTLLHKLTFSECEEERNLEKNSTGVSHHLILTEYELCRCL